jgi:hypothetical protein
MDQENLERSPTCLFWIGPPAKARHSLCDVAKNFNSGATILGNAHAESIYRKWGNYERDLRIRPKLKTGNFPVRASASKSCSSAAAQESYWSAALGGLSSARAVSASQPPFQSVYRPPRGERAVETASPAGNGSPGSCG